MLAQCLPAKALGLLLSDHQPPMEDRYVDPKDKGRTASKLAVRPCGIALHGDTSSAGWQSLAAKAALQEGGPE